MLVVAPINDLPVTTDIEFDVEEDSQLLEPGKPDTFSYPILVQTE